MEMGGKVSINCPKTGYRCDLEFKLKVIKNRKGNQKIEKVIKNRKGNQK